MAKKNCSVYLQCGVNSYYSVNVDDLQCGVVIFSLKSKCNLSVLLPTEFTVCKWYLNPAVFIYVHDLLNYVVFFNSALF